MTRRQSAVVASSVLMAGLLVSGCWGQSAASPSGSGGTRPYRLAFTPFPYLPGDPPLVYTYSRIANDADMMAIHIGDFGVPWPEASSDSFPYNTNVMNHWGSMRGNTPQGHAVYLALGAINLSRNGLNDLWSAAGTSQPLPAPWNGLALNDPLVKTAYLNYCRRAINYFNPGFVTIGIEVNLLMAVNPSIWAAYLDLHKSTYTALKAQYPGLPIMVSLTANEMLGYVGTSLADQARARSDVANYSDYFCVSMYLYQGSNAGGTFPADAFDRLAAMTSKPMAICETGYPSQGFTLRNGTQVRGDPNVQQAFFDQLFQAADRNSYRFIVNFFVRDLDSSLDTTDIVRLFRYDGLYDVNGNPKPAFNSWKGKRALGMRAAATASVVSIDRTSESNADSTSGSPADRTSVADPPQPAAVVALETTFVYTNDNRNGPNTVSAFAITSAGSLSAVPGSPFPTGGTGSGLWDGVVNDLAVSRRGFLYAANQRSGDISVFAIDASTGRITPAPGTPFHVSWTPGDIALAADPAQDVVIAANHAARRVARLAVAPNGSLTAQAPPTPVDGAPTMVKVSPGDGLVVMTLEGDGRIPVFQTATDGSLAAVAGSPFFGPSLNATSIDIGCVSGLVYTANGAIGRSTTTSIDVFRILTGGTLDPTPGSPARFVGVNGRLLLASPDNSLFFVADQGLRQAGDDSVTVLRTEGRSLSVVPRSPFPIGSRGIPTGMATSRSGQWLVTANYSDTRGADSSVGVFAVGADGALSALPRSPVAVAASSLASVATFPPATCGRATAPGL